MNSIGKELGGEEKRQRDTARRRKKKRNPRISASRVKLSAPPPILRFRSSFLQLSHSHFFMRKRGWSLPQPRKVKSTVQFLSSVIDAQMQSPSEATHAHLPRKCAEVPFGNRLYSVFQKKRPTLSVVVPLVLSKDMILS